jgi:hypothetical protein
MISVHACLLLLHAGKFYCPRMASMNKPCYAAIQVSGQATRRVRPNAHRSLWTADLVSLCDMGQKVAAQESTFECLSLSAGGVLSAVSKA